jgi:hypothetical protein
MPINLPNLAYESGDFSQPAAVSLPEFTAPFAGVNVDYVLTQDFMVNLNNFASLDLNTPHPDFSDFVLVAEGERKDVTGGKVQWTRTYAKVPATYSEPGGNISYHFIGLEGVIGAIGVTSVTGRERFSKNVPVKIARDFFLVGVGQTYTTFEAIPVISATRYYYGATPYLDIDYLADSPPFAQASNPSRTQYQAMITADASPNSFSIVAEDSVLTRWLGNIYIRETRYIKAL